MIWAIVSIILTIIYAFLQHKYLSAWKKIPECSTTLSQHHTFVSIIIPARDEALNIAALLSCIDQQDYPKSLFEIIVIDDHSVDNTSEVVIASAISNLKLYALKDILTKDETTEAYKKKAIEAAIHIAKGTLIITTDADCTMGKNWIKQIVDIYETQKPMLIAAPVVFNNASTSFEKFQVLDFAGMMAITFASLKLGLYNMANGANLAFNKAAFWAVDGYKDIDNIASGDDMLLVYKIAHHYNGNIALAKSKEAIVYTKPLSKINDFLQQRFRWTSKAGKYQDKRITLILALLYFFVLSLVINIFCALFISPLYIFVVVFQVLIKSIFDYRLLKNATSYFNNTELMQSFGKSQLMHILYILFVGTFGNLLKYRWKGRKLK